MNAPTLSHCKNRQLLSTEKRKKRKHNTVVYGIDRLPEEILLIILSRLTLKEAARTSVVSCRWRYLWRFTSGSLEFNFDRDCHSWTQAQQRKYVGWVDQVVKLHQGPHIEKFIVRCHGMYSSNGDSVYNWTRFAVQKDVRVFELDISPNQFPGLDKILSFSSALKSKHISFSSLTSFKLSGVWVTDEMIIHYLLSNCPCLEHLSLKYVHQLRNLNVVGPSLKSLVIYYCAALKTLTISAANLVSFEYGESICRPSGKPATDIQFQNVPLLSELKLDGDLCYPIFWHDKHLEYIHLKHQLEKLHLNVPFSVIPSASVYNSTHYFARFPQLLCLKKLELVLNTLAGESLFFFVLFTMSCPFLSRFNVEFIYERPAFGEEMVSALHDFKRLEGLSVHHHQHLKVVKLINFACFKSDFRFALALIEIAKSLEKMIIKPGSGRFVYSIYSVRDPRLLLVRERAKQLQANLPLGAELVIL